MNAPALLALLASLPPLLAAAAIAVRMTAGRDAGDAQEIPTARLATGAGLVSLAAVLALDMLALARGAGFGTLDYGVWLASGEFELRFSFLPDARALILSTLVATIGWLTLRFSVAYLHREPGFHRFFFALSLFLGGMQFIALAGGLAVTFAGWELAGLSSYLLIGYAREREQAADNALRAFVTNRIGDTGLIAAMAAAFLSYGSLQWQPLAAMSATQPSLAAATVAAGLVVAALVKSAQLPFAPWIARALEGPTPSSAVFYGALLVHAGVYLLIRAEPLLARAPALMAVLAALGLLTALYGWLAGLAQTDVKSALMFSTTTQVGWMFVALGLGWNDWALAHLVLHASFRAWQFLSAPSFLQNAPAPPRARLTGWLWGRRLHLAVLHRFWLEPASDRLLVTPTLQLARDTDAFDERVLSRIVGMPPALAGRSEAPGDAVIAARGLAGRALYLLAERLERFERRLVPQGGEASRRVRTRWGESLVAIEALLEQPRYLVLLVMVTLVVIL